MDKTRKERQHEQRVETIKLMTAIVLLITQLLALIILLLK